MSLSKNKNEVAWIALFTKYSILETIQKQGFYVITSDQINDFRESRLMTKFDHKANIPEIFQQNNLSILPLTRGSYIIGSFQTHHDVEHEVQYETVTIQKRTDLETLDYNNIYSESAAINCALASGIIYDLLEDQDCYLTVNGRMSTSKFNFLISENNSSKRNLMVENSQCEIDAGFETTTSLAIIEAKNMRCDDFLIRQIYYPYRLWKSKIEKNVLPIFMFYSNDKYSFFIYDFENEEDYNSIKLVKRKDYIFESDPISLNDIEKLLSKRIIAEPQIPFPQADNFERIIDLLGLLVDADMSKIEITENYDFDKRQTDYYFNGGKYLGLLEQYTHETDGQVYIKLTPNGRKIMGLNHREKNLALADCILRHISFREVFKKYLEYSKSPSRKEVAELIKDHNLFNVDADSTYYRRSQTILKWVDWIIELVGE
jgi:hypothetical protein